MWEMKKYCLESRSRGISYMKYVNGRRTGLVTFYVETAFYNGLLKERYKGGIEVTGRQGRRRTKLLDDLKERTGYSHLKEEALDRTMWRARFGRGFGPVVRQTTKWMNKMENFKLDKDGGKTYQNLVWIFTDLSSYTLHHTVAGRVNG